MEGNKEEAARAVRLAEKYLYEKGEKEKAIKFLKKSLSMDPSNAKAKELLAKVSHTSLAPVVIPLRLQRSFNPNIFLVIVGCWSCIWIYWIDR